MDSIAPQEYISMADAQKLATLSTEGLEVLCRLYRHRTSGTKLELACRIGNREGRLEHEV